MGHSLPALSLIFVKFKTMPVCSFMSLNVAKQLSRSAGAAESSEYCRDALKPATMLSATDGKASCPSMTA